MGGSVSNTHQTTHFYRSFSGTDALVFIMLPQTEPIILGSLSTISYSLYRDKKPVPLLGQINMGGFTRGTRLYAGTLIFTLLNQHWVNELREKVQWMRQVKRLKADELPLFDLMIVCANEYGAAMQMFIYGVDLTEEGQVLSVEDLFIENTFNFVARDVTNFSHEFKTESGGTVIIQPFVTINGFRLGRDYVGRSASSSDYLGIVTTQEIKNVQHLLDERLECGLDLTGEYDEPTLEAVKAYQYLKGYNPTGMLDSKTWDSLVKEVEKAELDKIQLTSQENLDTMESQVESSIVPISTPTTCTYSYLLDDWVSVIGLESFAEEDVPVKIQLSILFQSGEQKTFFYEEVLEAKKWLSLESFLSALIDEKAKSDPKRMNVIMYPLDDVPYKWNVTFK